MRLIYLRCTCNKSIAVKEDGVGDLVECPDCGNLFNVPEPSVRWDCQSCGAPMGAPAALEGGQMQCAQCKVRVAVPVSLDEHELQPDDDGDAMAQDSDAYAAEGYAEDYEMATRVPGSKHRRPETVVSRTHPLPVSFKARYMPFIILGSVLGGLILLVTSVLITRSLMRKSATEQLYKEIAALVAVSNKRAFGDSVQVQYIGNGKGSIHG